jgi:hypothetical protein
MSGYGHRESGIGSRASRAILGLVLVAGACDAPGVPTRLTPYEFRLSPGDSVFHWLPYHLPVRFYVQPAGQLPERIAVGIRLWEQEFLYGEFRGVVVQDSAAADVIVTWEGPPPPDAPLTDDPPRTVCEGGTLVPTRVGGGDGRVHFDTRPRIGIRWFAGGTDSDVVNCIARVATHEVGHAIGIFAHSDNPDDLMYRFPEVRAPSGADRATVQFLYHLPTDIYPWDDSPPMP